MDQDKIAPAYGVSYNANDHSGSVSAMFNVKGHNLTKVELDGKSSITCDGVPIKGSPIPIFGGYSYENAITSFKNDYTFAYTDNNGKVYTNKLSLQPIELIGEPDSWWTEDGAMNIPVSRALADDEEVHIFMNGDSLDMNTTEKQVSDSTEDGYYDSQKHSIHLTPAFFNDFPASKTATLEFTLKREIEKNEEAPAAGGGSSISYEVDRKVVLRKVKV